MPSTIKFFLETSIKALHSFLKICSSKNQMINFWQLKSETLENLQKFYETSILISLKGLKNKIISWKNRKSNLKSRLLETRKGTFDNLVKKLNPLTLNTRKMWLLIIDQEEIIWLWCKKLI